MHDMINPAPVQAAEKSEAQTALMNGRWSTTKKVHWASDVVNNEYKHRELPRSPITMQEPPSPHTMPPLKFHLDPNLGSSSSRGNTRFQQDDKLRVKPVANTSIPIIQKRSRPSPVKHSSKRSQSSSSTPRKRSHPTLEGTTFKSKTRQPKGADSKRRYSSHPTANIATKREGGRPRPVQIPMILPAVPEPPPFQRPPPTPRPGRLPTPDLDDIEDREFCCCNHSFCRGHYGEGDSFGGPESKLEAQMFAAQAYIQDRRN